MGGVASALAGMAAVPALMLTGGGTAVAGTCYYGDVCVDWGQAFNGATVSQDWSVVRDWITYYYPHNGTGGGQRVGNNNGSVCNAKDNAGLVMYYDSAWRGPTMSLTPISGANWCASGQTDLSWMTNNLRSSTWY